MLKTRIIPILHTNGRQCVKTTQFKQPARVLGPMMQYTKIMERRNIDELIIVDIEAAHNNRLIGDVEHLTKDIFCPLALGGGVRTKEDVKALLDRGADKIVIGSGVFNFTGGDENILSNLISECAIKYGSQCVTVALDCYGDRVTAVYNGVRHIVSQQWPIKSVAKYMESNGAGEIILSDIMREGMGCGYNLSIIESISNTVNIPVIANSGCGNPGHMLEAINAGATAVAAGSMFLFSEYTPKICASFLNENNINVRL